MWSWIKNELHKIVPILQNVMLSLLSLFSGSLRCVFSNLFLHLHSYWICWVPYASRHCRGTQTRPNVYSGSEAAEHVLRFLSQEMRGYGVEALLVH